MTARESHNSENCVPIAFAGDDNFMMPTCVAITSLLENSRKNTLYDVAILTPSEISREHVEKILSLEDKHSNCRITWINMGERFQDSRQRMGRISFPACYRLVLPSVFPSYDKMIYADGDVIFEDDLASLLKIDLEENYLGAVLHPGYYLDNRRDLENEIGVDRMKYFNSGVLLCNLKKMRQDKIEQKFLDDLETAYRRSDSERFQSLDQDILNRVCKERVHFLSFRYNVVIRCAKFLDHPKLSEIYDPTSFKESFENPAVIHFAHDQKPWNTFFILFRERWDKYFYISPYSDDTLRRKDLEKIMAGEWYRLFQGNTLQKFKFIAEKILEILQLSGYSHYLRRPFRKKKHTRIISDSK